MSLEASTYLGDNVSLICRDDMCTVYKLEDSTGEGMMTCYNIFPGVDLMYNDFHIDSCLSSFQTNADLFCIDHCREGRLEWEMDDGSYLYMEAADLQMSSRARHSRMFRFPLRHYHGITLAININEAASILPGVIDGFCVDIHALRNRFCHCEKPFIMRAGNSIKQIFAELYAVPEAIRAPFFKVKVLELLLVLSTMAVPPGGGERPYFYKTHVEKVKAIMALITSKPEKRYTLEELSARFDFPITSMKNCFKGVYGTSIYAYMKAYKMNAAAVRLRRTKDSVTTIALEMGYDSASKFSAAFKSVIGMTPAEYRKSVV
ncbi:helix-turn-helix domain-containing protein [Paenibacillus turpanensis]|uniref:helix-turn-helix domain-containing protein n=1 Tax=Paenibacillus turpanensis TaxID=2689078 RepID=UPI00140BD329|nr:AraC family transcriptional regulator [Paenibacillus turpanensis]